MSHYYHHSHLTWPWSQWLSPPHTSLFSLTRGLFCSLTWPYCCWEEGKQRSRGPVLWRADIHSGAGASRTLTRLVPALLVQGSHRTWRHWTWKTGGEIVSSAVSFAHGHGLGLHLKGSERATSRATRITTVLSTLTLLPRPRLLTHCMFTRTCSSPKQYQEVRSLWKAGRAAEAISEVLCVRH